MKKVAALIAFAAVAAAATLSYAGLPARTGVNGSLHDMNYYNSFAGRGNQDQYNRVCVFCHTPHNATVAEPGSTTDFLPLWGNAITQKDQTNFAYQWATPSNLVLTIGDPLLGPSRLCMTCHDGTLAIDAHVSNGTANNGTFKLSGSRAIGSNQSTLNQTHPIGFSYDDAVSNRNIPQGTTSQAVNEIVTKDNQFATAITVSATAGVYNTVVRNSNRTIGSVLYNNSIMTCATCHEVHNKENATQLPALAGQATPNYFLYAQEQQSLICLSCHIK
jgi:cytochrome c553